MRKLSLDLKASNLLKKTQDYYFQTLFLREKNKLITIFKC